MVWFGSASRSFNASDLFWLGSVGEQVGLAWLNVLVILSTFLNLFIIRLILMFLKRSLNFFTFHLSWKLKSWTTMGWFWWFNGLGFLSQFTLNGFLVLCVKILNGSVLTLLNRFELLLIVNRSGSEGMWILASCIKCHVGVHCDGCLMKHIVPPCDSMGDDWSYKLHIGPNLWYQWISVIQCQGNQ